MPNIHDLGGDLFSIEADIRVSFGVVFPLRTTIVRTPDGLIVISPTKFDETTASAIDAKGEVKFLVGPNRLHHLFLGDAKRRWPKAKLLGAPGLAEKRRDLSFDGVLHPGTQTFGPALEVMAVQGAPSLSEMVFFHASSRTLIVTDLVFHIFEPKGFLTGLVLRMVGAHNRLAQSRAFRFMTTDREAVRRSAEAILSLDFDRVVMAHGRVVESQAKAALEGAWWWMRKGALKALPAAT